MKKLSRYRCFTLIFVLLIADTVNINWNVAGKATWIAYLIGAIIALPFYRVCAYACKGGFFKSSEVLGKPVFTVMLSAWIVLSAFITGLVFGRFGLFIITYNDFVMSPHGIIALMAMAALALSLLKGRGLERYVEISFVWILLLFAIFFFAGTSDWHIQRLLPVYEGTTSELAKGFLYVFLKPFSGGFVGIALLSDQTDEKNLSKAAGLAAIAAGGLMGIERIKDISVIGYELASRYTFPFYALAGLQRVGSYGLHMEDFLVCAFITAKMIKAAAFIRFGGRCAVTAAGGRLKSLGIQVIITLAAFWAATVMFSSNSSDELWRQRSLMPLGIMAVIFPIALALIRKIKEKWFDRAV
ncbi:MAG: GerAB/ArcD/ProY family transporter [Clostridiaceae bacterium]|nr:GerAB/ArcD/ProY family transporter [Clostridiaceae bacterium]